MEKIDIKEYAKAPNTKGIYSFYMADELLFSAYTGDIAKRLDFLMNNAPEYPSLAWVQEADCLSWQSYDTWMDILLAWRETDKNYQATTGYRPWNSYVYLGVDFFKMPYLQVSNTTTEKLYYIGPFRNRFFVYDLIDIFTELSKSPYALSEKDPNQALNTSQHHDFRIMSKDDWYYFSKEQLLTPNVPNPFRKSMQTMMDALEFEAAEKYRYKADCLDIYADNLKAFILFKDLNMDIEYNDKIIKIENGHIVSTHVRQYTDNEELAYDKADLDEMLILWEFLKENYPEQTAQKLATATQVFTKKI